MPNLIFTLIVLQKHDGYRILIRFNLFTYFGNPNSTGAGRMWLTGGSNKLLYIGSEATQFDIPEESLHGHGSSRLGHQNCP